MRSNYKRLGDYIRPANLRNVDLKAANLLGINIDKFFMSSVANVVGTDMTTYKVVKNGQFACNRMHVGRDYRLPVALSKSEEAFTVSPAYDVFEIKEPKTLLPEYLMMWFSRKEFDRNAWFYTDADVRGGLGWKSFCDMQLPIPSPDKQKEIVKEYNTILNRIDLNNQLIQKLEETAQAIYKQWFVDFEFPNENGEPYKSAGGEMEFNKEFDKEIPKDWQIENLSTLANMKYGKMLSEEKFLEKGYPVYSGYGIRGYYSKYLYEEPQILVVARGVSGTGEVRMSPPKCYVTNLSIVVEINKKSVDKTYLYYFLKDSNLRSLDGGSAQSQITSGDLNKVRIVNPPLRLQKSASMLIDGLRNNINIKNDENKLLTTTKDILLSKLATVEN